MLPLHLALLSIICSIVLSIVKCCRKKNSQDDLNNHRKPLFGANSSINVNAITATSTVITDDGKPEVIKPSVMSLTQKEEDIANGKKFTNKDEHPTFEDIIDDWDTECDISYAQNPNTIYKKLILKPPKSPQSSNDDTYRSNLFSRLEAAKERGSNEQAALIPMPVKPNNVNVAPDVSSFKAKQIKKKSVPETPILLITETPKPPMAGTPEPQIAQTPKSNITEALNSVMAEPIICTISTEVTPRKKVSKKDF
uniref:Uncharacterized protein n=1 Tax=Rhabditophanes sp. KR3021 TaxID=114890 RepID=A0AC35TSV6_9BILA